MSRIAELAALISNNTAIVGEYFEAHGLPQPSYDINGPTEIAIPPSDEAVGAAHIAVLSATAELHNLMLGPKAMLMGHNRVDTLSLHGIYRFNIDKAFPIGAEATFEDISQTSGLNIVDTRRILRHAMTNGIFREVRPGVVSHTAASRLLASNSAVRDFVGAGAEEATPSHTKAVDALSQYGYASDPSQSGFSLAHNTPKGFYDELRDDPTRGRRWANAMSLYATIVPIDALVRTFDWPALAALGPIVDVGGGHGAVSVGLAKRLLSASSSSLVPPSGPSVKFIVQDLPHVVAEGPAHIEPELRDHVSFMPYDIRTPQPVIGAPVYFFRAIFHNWPDASCVEILRNQIPALTRPGVKIIIHDAITKDEEEPGTLPLYLEKRRRTMDLNMLAYFGSRERTQRDWEELIKSADARFIVRFPPPPEEPRRIIEVGWTGEGG